MINQFRNVMKEKWKDVVIRYIKHLKINIMKRRIESLEEFTIGGTDGEIGKVKEFYFDDQTWTIRYLIVETGGWLFGRKVLISPEAVHTPDWAGKVFPVNLTKEQIKHSPDIDTEKPVSRQHEMELHGYYSWAGYWGSGIWGGGMGTSGMMISPALPLEVAIHENAGNEETANPHLRSTNKVKGYSIRATDGEIGGVKDFMMDDGSWKIDFLLVEIGNWFSGKKVLISPKWIKEVNWESSTVIVNALEEQVKNSPEYKPGEDLTASFEKDLQDYYGGLIFHKE